MANPIVGWAKKHLLLSTALVILLAYALFEVLSGWIVFCRDAYVMSDVVIIAPEVNGPMLSLDVVNDQIVKAGALLFTIDPKPFQIEVDRQSAALDLARANLRRTQDQLALATSDIAAKQAEYEDATKNRQRAVELASSGALAQETLDTVQRAFQVSLAGLDRAQAAKAVAEQEISVQHVTVKQMEAAVAKATYELSRTQVRSPTGGRVAPFQLRPGSYLEAGRPVMALVTEEDWRVVANITERHLSGLQPGKRVWFTVGSDPWQIHTGRVRSIAPGVARSASGVSALPYVQPNTDWIRLPRRFPVEINLGDLPSRKRLFMGSDATVWWINR
ncbi:MAG: HlyD family secretion protein [Verrucomicrobia bacterium]|nr:HlyD family secretion protein [Verrucomicrobiota bacterium]